MPWIIGGAMIGSSLIGGAFGGKGKKGGGGGLPFVGTQTRSPGFSMDTGIGPNNALQTTLNRTGTPEQLEFTRRFPQMLSGVDTLKGMSAPTASLFRTSALGQVNAAENQAVGNLREQLARRGLSGASFSQDTEARVQGEFAQKRSEVELAAAQQEIALTTELINFENNLIQQALQRELSELGVASGVSVNMTQIASQNAAVQAQIAASERIAAQQSRGALLGTIIGAGAGAFNTQTIADAIKSRPFGGAPPTYWGGDPYSGLANSGFGWMGF